jgi:hypothetical protein
MSRASEENAMSEANEKTDSIAATLEELLGKVPEAGAALVQGCTSLLDRLGHALELIFNLRLVEAQSVLMEAFSSCHGAVMAQLARLWPS